MGTAIVPVGILFGGVLSVVCIFVAAWRPISRRLSGVGAAFARDLDRAQSPLSPDAFAYALVGIALGIWLVGVLLARPGPAAGAVALAMVLGFVVFAAKVYLRFQAAKRVKMFNEQLEQVLRMFAGAVRVGLGLRQALIHVADQSPEPARSELTRVVAASNLGLSLVDALDALAARMPTQETEMFARVIRVQSQTGSDLAMMMDAIADTIKDRRRFRRKVFVLTSQARATAWLLGVLPVALAMFILVSQPSLRGAELGTAVGRTLLFTAMAFDAAAIFFLVRMTKLDA